MKKVFPLRIMTASSTEDFVDTILTSDTKCPPLRKNCNYKGNQLWIWGENHNCLGCFKNVMTALPEIDVFVTPDFVSVNFSDLAKVRVCVLKHLNKIIITPDRCKFNSIDANCGNKCEECKGFPFCIEREDNVINKMFSLLDKSPKELGILIVCGKAHFKRICELIEKRIEKETKHENRAGDN